MCIRDRLIAGLTHEYVAKVGVIPWFDRVDSESNPLDKLSRGVMKGPWKLVRIRFPRELMHRLREAA